MKKVEGLIYASKEYIRIVTPRVCSCNKKNCIVITHAPKISRCIYFDRIHYRSKQGPVLECDILCKYPNSMDFITGEKK